MFPVSRRAPGKRTRDDEDEDRAGKREPHLNQKAIGIGGGQALVDTNILELVNAELNGIEWGEWSDDEPTNDKAKSTIDSNGKTNDDGADTQKSDLSSYHTARTNIPTIDSESNEGRPAMPDKFFQENRKRNMYKVVGTESEERNSIVYNIVSSDTGLLAKLQLQDLWVRQKLEPGCLINIVNSKIDDTQTFSVNRRGGYVILEPDILASVSQVVGQLWCARQVTLNERIAQSMGDNADAFRGSICHELLERAMRSNLNSENKIRGELHQILRSEDTVCRAYGLLLDQRSLTTLGEELVPFVFKFMVQTYLAKGGKKTWDIIKIRDIEDNYWNPQFGLKGKLDATVDVRKADGTEVTIPLEIKTGNPFAEGQNKTRFAHQGQVYLYSLLMNSRYKNVTDGLLVYVRENFWSELSIKNSDLQSLILLRNDLVQTLSSNVGRLVNLPRPNVDFDRVCGNCCQKNVCSLFLKGDGEGANKKNPSPVEEKLISATAYLSELEVKFFHDWFRFITLEYESYFNSNTVKQLWTIPPEKRRGCLHKMKLVDCHWRQNSWPKSFQATFEIHKDELMERSKSNISDFKKGDLIVIGTDEEVCICYCGVDYSTWNRVIVSVESNLTGKSKSGFYTLDKSAVKSPIARNYTYLADLMQNLPAMQRLREYIILKKQSQFQQISRHNVAPFKEILERYNAFQQRILLKAVATDSFLFVKGLPGTGKTSTIVGLIRLLVERGDTVLLVGYTSSSVDNILLKYKEFSRNFIRVGKEQYLVAEMQEFAVTRVVKSATQGVDMLREKLNKPPVVASTLLSLNHPIFSNRRFNYAILDEVSQALAVSCFGALALAEKYVLFGDPEQLPPIVTSGAAKLLGFDETLFSMMSTPANTAKLTMQYRMNSVVMSLANRLTYNNKMKCGVDELENVYLNLPTEKLTSYITSINVKERRKWLSYVASKKLVRSVLLLDTSKIGAEDSFENNSITNHTEVSIVMECVKLFLQCGLDAKDIGLITPYRSQVHAMKDKCASLIFTTPGADRVEVNTVDQYQGRDKKVIICSFTKARKFIKKPQESSDSGPNPTDEVKASILEDKRRLNVAITRAKLKLIMVGNMEYLKNFTPLKELFSILKVEQIVNLESADLTGMDGIPAPS